MPYVYCPSSGIEGTGLRRHLLVLRILPSLPELVNQLTSFGFNLIELAQQIPNLVWRQLGHALPAMRA